MMERPGVLGTRTTPLTLQGLFDAFSAKSLVVPGAADVGGKGR